MGVTLVLATTFISAAVTVWLRRAACDERRQTHGIAFGWDRGLRSVFPIDLARLRLFAWRSELRLHLRLRRKTGLGAEIRIAVGIVAHVVGDFVVGTRLLL